MALKCAPTGQAHLAPRSRLVSTQLLVQQDHRLSALGEDHQLFSALLEQISLQPSLETILERVTCAGRVVFFSQGSTFGRPLVFRNSGLFHDVLALPYTCKWQVPEIAVNKVLKASANNKHFLGGLHVRLDQP
jgi:hypothetical protein